MYLLIAVMLVFQAMPAYAQGKTPSDPDQLTSAQMGSAVVVSNGFAPAHSKRPGQVYRFANCDKSNPNDLCYFVVTTSDKFIRNSSSDAVVALASTATITCGKKIYNSLGQLRATLQQNVGVTFSGTYGQTPVTLNWGDRAGTGSSPWYSWSDLTGPNPNPNWGVYVARTQTAYSTAGGMLTYAAPGIPGWSKYYSSRITINSSGWYCS